MELRLQPSTFETHGSGSSSSFSSKLLEIFNFLKIIVHFSLTFLKKLYYNLKYWLECVGLFVWGLWMSNIIILFEIKATISNSFELLRYNWSRSQSREPEPEIFWRLRLRLHLALTGSKSGGSGGSGSATLGGGGWWPTYRAHGTVVLSVRLPNGALFLVVSGLWG